MSVNASTLEQIAKVKYICHNLVNNTEDLNSLTDLRKLIENIPNAFINICQPIVLSAFYPVLKKISENKLCYSNQNKQLIIEVFNNLFKKSYIKNASIFFNIYSFLLFEIYDPLQNKVILENEEYKLAILECSLQLAKSLASDEIFEVYKKENAPKLCQMVYVAIEIAKTERMRALRITAIECIMAFARVSDDNEFNDIVTRKHVAQVFLFFLPGLASGLKKIALEDEKVGHKVPQVAIKAWGRLITLLVQDYNPVDNKFDIINFKQNMIQDNINITSEITSKKKFKNNKEIKEYLQNTKHGTQWYVETDKKLQPFAVEMMKLTSHSRDEVRLELIIMCKLVIEHCLTTIPRTVAVLIEIVITLTENENNEMASICKNVLLNLSQKFSSDTFQSLLETLEEGFSNGIDSLPRKFNSVDEMEQSSSLNLLIGYVQLFGEYKMSYVLLTGNHLQKLLNTLIHISKLESKSTCTVEELSCNEFDSALNKPAWKTCLYIRNDMIQKQLEKLCSLLGKYDTFKIVSDFLLDVFLYQPENRKEVIFILNEVIAGHQYSQENGTIIKDILNLYIEDCYWNVPLSGATDEFGHRCTSNEIQSNTIQVCLLIEGIGKIALLLGKQFENFTLQLLYMILEKAGQKNSLVRTASLYTLKDITIACGYKDITNLINENMDFFSFYIERKLHKHNKIENTLNVLSIVLKYSSVHVLNQISVILEEVLVQSCDQFKGAYATEYLEVFNTFIECIWKWYNIKNHHIPIKSRDEQMEEMEPFKVTGAKNEESTDFSDDIMNKSAEELYKEDMEKKKEDLKKETEEPEVEEYKKTDPPLHIKITVGILKTALNFLPSKDRDRKFLTLKILNGGLEIIKDWEDELLPIVHLIWSPLVERFKEYHDPLVINYSFQLLHTLARLSKDFIRIRTIKEVMPSIITSLEKFSSKSYLQDKGSAYRYSQGYKLQLTILEHLGKIMSYLSVQEDFLKKICNCGLKYLSDKQPIPLQELALQFFKDISVFDKKFLLNTIKNWRQEHANDEFEKNIALLYNNV